MSDGIRDELRELLFDSAPPPAVDTEAMFERTFAADGPDGADLLPPDGLFDLPADDPADEVLVDDPSVLDDAGPDDAGPDDAGPDDGLAGEGDEGLDGDALADPAADAGRAWDADGDAADPGASDVPFDEPGAGAGW